MVTAVLLPADRFSAVIGPIDWLTGAGNLLSGLCLLGIFGLIAVEIAVRNLLGMTIGFSWDVAAYLMGACFMLAAASALKAGVHVRVTAVQEMLGPKGAWRLDLFAAVFGLVIAVALAWALIEMAWISGKRGSASASAYRIPLVWPQALVASGAALLALQALAQVLRMLRGEALSQGPGLE